MSLMESKGRERGGKKTTNRKKSATYTLPKRRVLDLGGDVGVINRVRLGKTPRSEPFQGSRERKHP